MNDERDTCARLRRLHAHLVQEINMLKETVSEEEREGVVNPVETITVIDGLQKALHTIHLELQKCPGNAEI
ncbi:MAG: hypothetical protein NVSMB27_10800 [Ktedonobacteraceae bacterium]